MTLSPGGLVMLDTNVVVQLIRGKALGQRIDATYGLSSAVNKPLVCVVSIGEALSLVTRWDWGPKKRNDLEVLFRQLVVVPIDSRQVLDKYAEIDAHLTKRGERCGENDTWIAAAAAATSATLLTTDTDFDRLHPTYLTRIWIDPNSTGS